MADGETLLPTAGRPGNPPAWPLSKASTRERAIWRSEWKRPQAVAWEHLGLEVLVATYVRTLARFEEPGSPVGLGTQVRQLADSLGLSAPGMRMLRWRIRTWKDDTPAKAQPRFAGEDETPSRERLRPYTPPPGHVPVKERFTIVGAVRPGDDDDQDNDDEGAEAHG